MAADRGLGFIQARSGSTIRWDVVIEVSIGASGRWKEEMAINHLRFPDSCRTAEEAAFGQGL